MTSKYKGVSYIKNPKARRKWEASIKRNDKKQWTSRIHAGVKEGEDKTYHRRSIYIGVFSTEEEAGLAYNEKAKELYGEFAYQNKI